MNEIITYALNDFCSVCGADAESAQSGNAGSM